MTNGSSASATVRSPLGRRYEYVGLLCGIVLVPLTLIILSSGGPEEIKSDWGMRAQLALMCVNACLILSISIITITRAKAASGLVRMLSLLVVAFLGALGVFVQYPAYSNARHEISAIGDIVGMSNALISFIHEHDGCLPQSVEGLIEGGYITKDGDGRWRSSVGLHPGSVIRDPRWFDIASGVRSEEMTENGWIERLVRPAVRPAKPGAPAGFESVTDAVSKWLAREARK